MNDIESKIFDSVRDIEEGDWNSVFRDVPEGYDFYRAMEESSLEQFRFFYAVFRRNGKTLLIAPIFAAGLDLDITFSSSAREVVRIIRRILPGFFSMKTLFCGSPFGENAVLGFAGHLKIGERRALICELIRLMDDLRGQEKISFTVFKDCPETADAVLSRPLRSIKFFRIDSLPSAGMEIDFSSMEEYLKRLSGSTRKDLRRKLRRGGQAGVKIEVVDSVEDIIDDIYSLYLSTYKRGEVKFEKLTKEFFIKVSKGLKPKARFFLYYADGRLSAFNLCFIHNDVFIDKFIGFDYNDSRRYSLYFLSWCRNIQWCLSNSIRYYQVGQTNYAPKLMLGARLVPMYAYVKHHRAAYNIFLMFIARLMKLSERDMPAGLRSKAFSSIREIGREEWEPVYPPVAETYGFLKTVEESLRGQYRFYYISVYEGSRMTCAVPCFVLEYPISLSTEGMVKKIFLFLERRFPKLFILKVLACGSPSCEGRIALDNSFSGEAVLKAIEREMWSIAAREGASVIAFKDFSKEYARQFKPLKSMRFHRMGSFPSVELDLNFKTFEEYLSSLSRATRMDLRRKFRKTDGKIKIEMEVRTELGELLDDAYRLYSDNLKRSSVEFEKMTKDFFRDISKNEPGRTRFFVWRVDGRLVAFSLCLVSGETMVGEYLGFDYDVAYEYHLYFIIFRDRIRWCLANGIRRYETGALNYDPKKRLDFKFVPQYLYVKHRNRLVNKLLKFASVFIEPERFDPVLKAMRTRKKR